MYPKISVITVILNPIQCGRKKHLVRNIKSVYNQTYRNIEHIIIDGGSTDGSVNYLNKLNKKYPIIIYTEIDKGIYDAMNKGIKKADGEYVIFLNSDDYFNHRNGLKYALREMQGSKADFGYGSVIMTSFKDGKLTKLTAQEHPHINPLISNVFFYMPVCHQSMIFKKSVLIDLGLFDISYRIAGDYNLTLTLCLKNYKSIQYKVKFVTFSTDGLSNSAVEQSIQEIHKIHYIQYKKMFSKINKRQVQRIFYKGNIALPTELVRTLTQCIYFDAKRYHLDLKNHANIIFRLRQLYNTHEYLLPTYVTKLIKTVVNHFK